MRKHLIGIIALVLLSGAVFFWINPPDEGIGFGLEAACWRVGALMTVLWLAYDELYRVPAWLWPMALTLLVILAIRPRWFVFAVPIIVALAILRPRFGRRQ